jgi:hypothetical protein
VLTAGPVTYTLAQLPAEAYPALPDPGLPDAEFGADHLAAAVAQAAPAASHDDSLPTLTCAQLTLDGEGTAVLGTRPYTPVLDCSMRGPMLIHARDLAAAVKGPGTATVALSIALDGSLTGLTAAAEHQTPR